MQGLDDILNNPWRVFAYDYALHLGRYVLIAGGAYLIFYVLFRRSMLRRKVQAAFPRLSQMRREVLFSLLTFAIFAATGVLTATLHRAGLTRLYMGFDDFDWPYFLFSLTALILIHDAWFYWTHRLMHWPPLFRIMHRVHHRSHSPSPWAAFSFHPLEAATHAIVFPLVAMVLPIHLLAAAIWLLYMTVMNVGGHLGFELMPRGFARHRLFGWHNTAVHHDMHHSHVRCNYGLYFNVWDRLMGTNHPDYLETYDRVCGEANDATQPSLHADAVQVFQPEQVDAAPGDGRGGVVRIA